MTDELGDGERDVPDEDSVVECGGVDADFLRLVLDRLAVQEARLERMERLVSRLRRGRGECSP